MLTIAAVFAILAILFVLWGVVTDTDATQPACICALLSLLSVMVGLVIGLTTGHWSF